MEEIPSKGAALGSSRIARAIVRLPCSQTANVGGIHRLNDMGLRDQGVFRRSMVGSQRGSNNVTNDAACSGKV
ncbi:hypothetical protein FOPE_04170 [Fonsecaea pedrosoi]|nr:hypothetical protein FOPE_04170 [Fonsecaea pedrosoi]